MLAPSELTDTDLHGHFDVILSRQIQTFSKHAPTFLEVAGFPDYENVLSNIYRYFLSDRNHGLGQLFMTALLRCANAPGDFQMDAWKVGREVTVQAGRIDLVITEDAENPQKVNLVENKIYHNADGNDFSGYLDAYRKVPNVLGILLTLEPSLKVPEEYRNITHLDWIKEVKISLGEMITDLSPQQLMLLQDFIRHIDRYYKTKISMDSYKFLFTNAGKISALIELRDNAVEQLKEEIRKAVNGEWQYYRSSGSSVAFQRGNLVMYVTTDRLFHPDQPLFQVQLWIRGVEAVKRWKERKVNLNPSNGIQPHDNQNTREWAQIATKDYQITYHELEELGGTVSKKLESDWNEYVVRAIEIVRAKL